MHRKSWLVVLCVTGLAVRSGADVRMPSIFSDGMVLQCDAPVRVFGAAANGEKVTVTVDGNSAAATASDGKWQVELPAHAAGGPFTMTVEGARKIEIKDVYYGEVWLCGGQSNMQSPMICRPDPDVEGRIHMFGGLGPRQTTHPGTWAVTGTFSKIAWYVGNAVAKDRKAPVGLVYVAQGGTPVRPWIGPTGSLYRVWLDRLAGYRIAGAVWWQGENDAHNEEAADYESLFRQVVTSWRKAWGQGDFPFVWVQLQRFGKKGGKPDSHELPEGWNQVRDAQRRALSLPATAMAVAFDVTRGANHPPPDEKFYIGQRMGRAVLAVAYGRNVEWSGPLLASAERDGGKIVLSFTHSKGLKIGRLVLPPPAYDDHDTTSDVSKLPPLAFDPQPDLADFEIQSGGGAWQAAKAALAGDTVVIPVPGLSPPFRVRSGWKRWPEGNLYNAGNLPASPFLSDEIK